jgi:hypothetical protein
MENKDLSEDPRVKELLATYSERRGKVDGYIDEMEGMKDQIMGMFPEKLDHRSKYLLEEKIKASSSFYHTLLSLTQEYNKSVVQEIEIIRKLSMGGDNKEKDIRQLVRDLQRTNPELVKQIEEKKKAEAEQIVDDSDTSEEINILDEQEESNE